ncbi:beta strand repeat-containing protein [Aquimarina sp. 2201CG5-10]|uniref:beta strand repeat-containing protein n=1 Tax=Aquimarina callyspongiae TaxID=3098150 RepID=UPI002AB42445|nr:Ig-like domain-containing protein [Aquimarina sp. 2201CG5-10]MDY8136800.1 T9SS type A sorting domain-containing protein [Aquimarina sp. 2201CG5-10]
MKKILHFLVFVSILNTSFLLGQTPLTAGDIAIIHNQTDNPDDFAFVTFVDLQATTVIYFTDCGADAADFNTPCTEGAHAYTVPAGGHLAGTIIKFQQGSNANFASYTDTVITGSFNLSFAGDQIIAFQDTANPGGSSTAAGNPTFIFASNTASTAFTGDKTDTNQTGLPNGLDNINAPVSALGLGSGTGVQDEFDNVVYNGGYTFSTIAEAKLAFSNPANYTQVDDLTTVPYPTDVSNIPSSLTVTPPDTTNPRVQSITRQTPGTSPTNADTLIFAVQFDEAVSNVTDNDFQASGLTTPTISAADQGGNLYHVTISGGDLANFNGTVNLGFAVAQDITDTAGNPLTNTSPIDPVENYTVDNNAPTVSIGAPSATDTNSGPVTYTITYTSADAVTLANGDITLNTTGTANGNVAVTGTGTATRTVTISSITGDGTIGISIAANTASDNAGNNAAAAGPSATFNVDNTAPTLSIGAPSATGTNSGPVTYTITYTNADAVTLANGDITLNTTGTANGNVAVTGTGTATRTVTISSITGDGTIGISIAANTASDNAGNNAVTAGPSATFNVDNTAPTISIGAPSATDTNSGPVTYTITYTNADAVTLASGDITLNTTGTANGSVAVSGTGTATRTVTISSITGDGTIGISIAANTASDTAGNNAAAAGPSATFNVDNTAPTLSIGAPSATDTNSGLVTYTITYTNADAVTLANGDISLNTTGTANGSVAVSGTGTTTRTVTISSITGDGTIGISIAANTASDTAGNNAAAAGPSATFNVDNTAPTLSISAPSATDTNSGPVTYTITYTNADAVTLANGDITLNTTGTANGSVTVSGTGTTTRTVTISSITGNGTIGISIAANTASDTAGNNAAAAGPSATFNVDNTAPTLSISAPSATDTNSGPVTYTITYTNANAVTLASGDITLNTTGDATGSVAVSGTGTATRTVTISSITGNGTIGISIAANTASDTAGNNAAAAGPSATFNVDNTAPTGYSATIDQAPINSTNETAVSFTFAAAVVGTTYNYTFTSNGGGTPVTGSGTITTTTDQITGINVSGLGDGTVTLSVTLTDGVGNVGNPATDDIAKDTSRPSVSITSTETSPTGANPIPVTITFSEIVGGFTEGEITVVNGSTGNFSGGASNTYTVDITPSGAGPITITVNVAADVATDMSGNGNTAAPQFSIDFDNTLGFNDDVLEQGLSLYPIPNKGIVNIAADTGLQLKNAEVFDITGKRIYSQDLNTNNQVNTIDISNAQSGIYLIKIHSANATATKRIVIE